MTRANAYYNSKQFTNAINLYEQAAKAGVVNGNLYYNLGNAYWRTGDTGRAMLNWSRAERLNPSDPDLRFNLVLSRSQIARSLVAQPSSKISDFFRKIRDLARARVWALVLVFALWAFWLCLSARILLGGGKLRAALSILTGLFIILMVTSGMGFAARELWETEPAAVVIGRDVSARSGPGAGLTPVFNLPAGARVIMSECRNGYCQVELPPGMVGWVEGKDIQKI